jgi:hypothetical protein
MNRRQRRNTFRSQLLGELVRFCGIRHGNDFRAVALDLARKFIQVRARGQRYDTKSPRQ